MAQDSRYLQQRRQRWFVVVEVPPVATGQVRAPGNKRTLRTCDINLARARRWQVVADIQAQFEAARRGVQGDPLRLEALALREALARNKASDRAGARIDWDNPEAHLYEGTDDIFRGQISERALEIEREQGYAVAETHGLPLARSPRWKPMWRTGYARGASKAH